jgi:hypothetical protein
LASAARWDTVCLKKKNARGTGYVSTTSCQVWDTPHHLSTPSSKQTNRWYSSSETLSDLTTSESHRWLDQT